VISLNGWHYLAWTMLIIVYGVFMPNTWKRAASILIPLSMIPLAAAVVLRSICPPFADILDRNQSGQPFLAPLAAAGIAIYAAHKFQDARAIASEVRRLGQYRLTRLIGDGGMGQVYEAEHLLLKRPCAVKYIRPDRSGDARLLRRFEREVQATAKLTHPHTIEVYDYGKTKEGMFYFVMEYLPGMNLQELVRSAGPLPPARAVHFLVQVCDALTEAHGARLIHRDIKPANIFASQRGGIYDFTKLLDFGVVRESEASMSLSGKMVAGTPSYMSPEQATRPEAIDARSDLYSVGSVGYFLLCGRPPFVASSPMQVMQSVVEQTPDPLSVHRPDVPPDLQAVLMRCLAKDPQDRFPSARILCEELQKCQCSVEWTRADAEAWWQSHDAIASAHDQPMGDTRVTDETEAPLRTSPD
jgi:serine/threonine-protein kinase